MHDAGSYGDFNETERETYLLDKNIRGRELLPGMVLTIEPGIYLIFVQKKNRTHTIKDAK